MLCTFFQQVKLPTKKDPCKFFFPHFSCCLNVFEELVETAVSKRNQGIA